MKIEKVGNKIVGQGDLVGKFEAVIGGDGNSKTYTITCTGDQFDIDKPLTFTVMGEWEMMDLVSFLKAIVPTIEPLEITKKAKIIQIATASYGDKDDFNNEVIGLTDEGKVLLLKMDKEFKEYLPVHN